MYFSHTNFACKLENLSQFSVDERKQSLYFHYWLVARAVNFVVDKIQTVVGAAQ
jgi:hypothetical protein